LFSPIFLMCICVPRHRAGVLPIFKRLLIHLL
jgi:hypothetical protein